MYLLYRFINSVLLMLVNLAIATYTCRRLFGVMRSHYKLVAEVAHFNTIVRQSRLSLDYMNGKVSEAMKEIEGDIGKELYMTHNLTKISSKMALILRRFNALEEGVIELVRMDHNTESVKVETPGDINAEVKKILTAARKKERNSTLDRPKTPRKTRISSTILTPESSLQNPVSKFSAIKPTARPKADCSEFSVSTITKGRIQNTSEIGPNVKLLSEKKYDSMSRSIGFRPSWKCEA